MNFLVVFLFTNKAAEELVDRKKKKKKVGSTETFCLDLHIMFSFVEVEVFLCTTFSTFLFL